MITGWPIRKKLAIGATLLLISVALLAVAGFHNVYSFRELVRSISRRANEWPVAVNLAAQISRLHGRVPTQHSSDDYHLVDWSWESIPFTQSLDEIKSTLSRYRTLLEANKSTPNTYIGNIKREMDTVRQLEARLAEIESLRLPDENTWPDDYATLEMLDNTVERMNLLAEPLPRYLQERMRALQGEVRGHYRTWIIVTWITSLLAGVLLIVLIHLFYQWVLQPLRQLINGSRMIAAGGDFAHRIHLDSGDEMEELAMAMNDMSERFQQIRDDLNRQVKQRTREVIRGEQLASVGFLAAGVAHEINNPLASIALCAESLEERISDLFRTLIAGAEAAEAANGAERSTPHTESPTLDSQSTAAQEPDEADSEIIHDYLRMIQQEAFRCKGITEKLLDFSRLGDVQRQETELVDLVQGVVEMVQHVGKYKEKELRFQPQEAVHVHVNPQEIKQVVLNLITNGLESLECGGTVTVKLYARADEAVLEVTDNGCGMTEEVRSHLFEPFFTRRRDGQGTGLGMSISYRILNEHGAHIDVASDGLNRGSTITVRFPLTPQRKEHHHRQRAA